MTIMTNTETDSMNHLGETVRVQRFFLKEIIMGYTHSCWGIVSAVEPSYYSYFILIWVIACSLCTCI